MAHNGLVALTSIILVCLLAVRVIRRYIRLAHIPGPFLASLTNLWLLRKYWTDIPFQSVSTDLHRRYGPVVRVGPNRVLFAQASALPVIFRTSDVFHKADSYDVLLATVRGKQVASFITIRDEQRVSALKRHLSSAFLTSTFLKQEHEIDYTTDILIQQLKHNGPKVNIAEMLSYFTFDTLSRIAFSEDAGFMLKQQDIGDTLESTRARFAHWHYWLPMPGLERLLYKNKYTQRMVKPSMLAKLAVQKIADRKESSEDPEAVTDLLGKYLAASRKDPGLISPQDVIGFTVSTINAGADTTSSTTSAIVYRLCRHPKVLHRLRGELDEASLSTPPKFAELDKLPYMEAVIRETMRFDAINADPIERVVPRGGLDLCGTWVPEGTVVAVSHHLANREPDVWGQDADCYNPDRWLTSNDAQRAAMGKCFVGFGGGKRTCLGQHLAMIEMKKVIANLFNTFDISLADPTSELKLGFKVLAEPFGPESKYSRMLPLRRAGLRLLSASPSSFAIKSRSITSFAPSPCRSRSQALPSIWQRRWASGQGRTGEDAPISELQPTPQEEVENAIQSDNAAESESAAPQTLETAGASEADSAPEAQAEARGQAAETSSHDARSGRGIMESAFETAKETVSDTAQKFAGAASSFQQNTSGREGESSRRPSVHEPKSTVYIGNLFFDVTENDLSKELARFGTVKKIRLMRDSRGLSKGFGYVDFETVEQATKVVEAMNQQLFEGRRLAVQYAAYSSRAVEERGRTERPSKPLNEPSKTLFIGNMSFEMTDRDLNNLFRGIRNVIDVRVAIDRRTGQPRGFAHADFVDVKSAMEAMKVLEGKETYGRKLRLDYSYGSSSAPRNQGLSSASGAETSR